MVRISKQKTKGGDMEKITKYQKAIMKHAISEPNRNWFGTLKNSRNSVEFEKLVGAGYATRKVTEPWMGDEVIYRITKEGRKALELYYKD
jgi:hypothetical protein